MKASETYGIKTNSLRNRLDMVAKAVQAFDSYFSNTLENDCSIKADAEDVVDLMMMSKHVREHADALIGRVDSLTRSVAGGVANRS